MSDEKRAKAPSVVDGVLMRTSVSAMQKADGCLRAYFYKYATELPDKPEGAGAKLGKESHARIEHFLKTGENVLNRLERVGLEKGLIPQPHPALIIEGEFTHLKAADVDMVGYIDLEDPRDPAHIRVTDWKFKKDLSQYMATREQLIDPRAEAGIQMIGYAEAMRLKHPQARTVTLRHVNFQTQGRMEVIEVSTGPLELSSFAEKWVTVTSRLVPRMKAAVAKKDAQEVEKNESICDRYGGCAYLSACKDRTARILHHRRSLSALAAQTKEEPVIKFGNSAPAPQPQPIPPGAVLQATQPAPVTVVPPKAAPGTPRVLKARDAVQEAIYTVGNGIRAKFLVGVSKASGTVYAFVPLTGGGPIQLDGDTMIVGEASSALPAILPPDAPASNPALAARVDVPTLPPKQVVPQTETQMVAALEASIEATVTAPQRAIAEIAAEPPTPAPPPEEPKKAKRTRTAKIENVPDTAAIPAVTNLSANPVKVFDAGGQHVATVSGLATDVAGQLTQLGQLVGQLTAPSAEAPAPQTSAFYLYFVGSPVGIPTKTLNTYIEALDAEIRKAGQLNVPDIRLAPAQSDFGFMKWKAYLSKLALEMPPPAGHYVVTPGDERIDCVANALIEKAALVVR